MNNFVAQNFSNILAALILAPMILAIIYIEIYDILTNLLVKKCYNLAPYDYKDNYNDDIDFIDEIRSTGLFKSWYLYFKLKRGTL